jgi:hypothetical protein
LFSFRQGLPITLFVVVGTGVWVQGFTLTKQALWLFLEIGISKTYLPPK